MKREALGQRTGEVSILARVDRPEHPGPYVTEPLQLAWPQRPDDDVLLALESVAEIVVDKDRARVTDVREPAGPVDGVTEQVALEPRPPGPKPCLFVVAEGRDRRVSHLACRVPRSPLPSARGGRTSPCRRSASRTLSTCSRDVLECDLLEARDQLRQLLRIHPARDAAVSDQIRESHDLVGVTSRIESSAYRLGEVTPPGVGEKSLELAIEQKVVGHLERLFT